MAATPRSTAGVAALPFPPADLHSRPLPTRKIRAGSWGHRSHDPAKGVIWFGPEGATPAYRFDDPRGVYKVCYIGEKPLAAFVETFLRELPTRTVTEKSLRSRVISTVRFVREVVVVRAYGKGLAQLGTTAALGGAKLSGAANPYEHSQAWSRAIYDHPDGVGGLEFRSSHDDDLRCLALFDRTRTSVADGRDAQIIWENRKLILEAIERYQIEIL